MAVLASQLGLGSEAAAPPIAASLDLDKLLPSAVRTTVAFISDEEIVVGRYPGSNGSLSAAITVIQWREGKLRLSTSQVFSLERASFGRGLFPAAHGSVIVQFLPTALLLSADLELTARLPIKVLVPPVHQGAFVGGYEGFNHWSLYRLVPQFELLRRGNGEILSVSDDFIVLRDAQEVRIETVEGEPRGRLQVPLRSVCYARPKIAGPGRLLISDCGPARIVDFNGKELLKIPTPDGWGFRYGLSLDGNRILFDHYTRRIPAHQRMFEAFESLISLGMGPVIDSIGEMIRVVDTTNGGVCLDIDSPKAQFGMPGEYHADISPSGRFVALVSENKLSVYQTPIICRTR
jgi:hypothetical protein